MRTLLLLLMVFGTLSCVKKIKQEAETNIIVEIMTNGRWKVSNYMKGGSDLTQSFSPYLFQFKSDNTVDALNNGLVEKSGTWTGDANAQTIASNFPNTTDPLVLLNGTWQLTNTGLTFVQASQTVSGEQRTLRLDKQ
jgi:hypothetical protein